MSENSLANFEQIRDYLRNYSGRPLRIMEVCGTHTAAISENGIPSMLSDNIKLISGPGCPVCVTVTSVIDRLVELAMTENTTVLTFGDLIRVRGSVKSLADAKSDGGSVRMVYSPMDAIDIALNDPGTCYVFAAIGFETTTPVYALLIEESIKRDIRNIKILTSLKTMPEVIRWVVSQSGDIDGFIAPGHVAAVTGGRIFRELSEELGIPFVVSGFEGSEGVSTTGSILRDFISLLAVADTALTFAHSLKRIICSFCVTERGTVL